MYYLIVNSRSTRLQKIKAIVQLKYVSQGKVGSFAIRFHYRRRNSFWKGEDQNHYKKIS